MMRSEINHRGRFVEGMTAERLRQRAFLTRELAEQKTLSIVLRQQLRISAMQDEAAAGAIEHAQRRRD